MIDDLLENTYPCQESLGANCVDVAANVASLWLSAGSLQCRQKNCRNVTEMIQSGCQTHCKQLISLFLSTNVGQKLYLSPALWHNLSIV